MEEKKLNIDDLLNSLRNPNKALKARLINSKNTWTRIGSKDSFTELGLEPTALESFLKEWCQENPYNNL